MSHQMGLDVIPWLTVACPGTLQKQILALGMKEQTHLQMSALNIAYSQHFDPTKLKELWNSCLRVLNDLNVEALNPTEPQLPGGGALGYDFLEH